MSVAVAVSSPTTSAYGLRPPPAPFRPSSAPSPISFSTPEPPHPPKGDPQMPEAVIVDAVRTPIGRAFKGSLAQQRPDEMGAFAVDSLLERNPDVSPDLIEDVFCGCGMPQGLQA